MPMSMVTNYKDIKPKEIAILQRQFQKSHFYKHQSDAKPTKLAIFDFDSTLFFSPLLSPTIWHPQLISLATAESVYGPGWWRDIRSLDLGPFEELKKTAWKGFWNEDTVKEARECIKDPNTMTVVLTGRRFHPFHLLIPDMLESKDLHFDLIGLRPDPEHVSDNHWEVRNGYRKLTYNLASSVFKSTMHFKTCFILNILHNVPSLKNVVMWDDRIHHVNRFKEYLSQLHSNCLVDESSVIYVPGIRPKYNPGWEVSVIQHIIETHNKAIMDHSTNGVKVGTSEQRLTWSVVEKEDPLESSTSDAPLKLTKIPCATIVKLSQEDTDLLHKQYEPIFKKQLEASNLENAGGEEPVYFGTSLYISPQQVIPSGAIPVGPIGTNVNVTVKAYSQITEMSCLLLSVELGKKLDYILPLWYKPSEHNDIFKLQNINWESAHEQFVLSGTVDYEYRLGVKDKAPVSKKRGREVGEESIPSEAKKTKLAKA